MLWTKTYKNIKHIFAYIFKKILFIYFLERGGGKEKDRKRNINVWSPLTSPPMRNLAHKPGLCPDWESNLQTFGLQACAQSSEPHNAGLFACIFKTVVAACNMRSNLSSCYVHCRAWLTESVTLHSRASELSSLHSRNSCRWTPAPHTAKLTDSNLCTFIITQHG